MNSFKSKMSSHMAQPSFSKCLYSTGFLKSTWDVDLAEENSLSSNFAISSIRSLQFIQAKKMNEHKTAKTNGKNGCLLILCAKIALNAVICIIWYIFYLDNGVMTTPKHRTLLFIFTVLCFKKLLSIKISEIVCMITFFSQIVVNVFKAGGL